MRQYEFKIINCFLLRYTLSPYEQRPFAGILKKGLPNMVRRFLQEVPYIAPPALAAYGIYAWATAESEKVHRKGSGHH